MFTKKFGLLAIIVILVGGFFVFGLGDYLTLEYFQTQKQAIDDYYQAQPVKTGLIYFFIYLIMFALALPAGAVLTLAGGAIFGLGWGTLLVSFASSIGSTLAFLASRSILRDWVEQRFGSNLAAINKGVEKEGPFYLFTLRLVPIFPPAAINLLMGLTRIKVLPFYIVSQLGMLAGTLVYINAGTQLAQINPDEGILSADLILAFVLLGVFPLIAKKIVDWLQSRKVYRGFTKPRRFDTNMVVIGAGSGGLVTSYIAAAVKAKVTLIEKHKMGGDCLNFGCVPSKTIIRSAKINNYIKRAEEFGIRNASAEVDFAAVMERVQSVIKAIEPHDSIERFTELGVDCVQGTATITSPYSVEVNGETITTRTIVIAAGARPFVPAIAGVEDIGYLTSDTVWELREQPQRLLVIGGGPIGSELAQSFARLGSQVTIVQRGARIQPREDTDVSDLVAHRFAAEGIDIRTECTTVEFGSDAEGKYLDVEHAGQPDRIRFDQVLIAVGRKPNTENMGLEELGIELTDKGTIDVNDYLQTKYPNIYAVGDIAGPYQFTHTAAHQAWYAAVNGLFGRFRKFKVDYSVIPWATFTDPEVGRVGLNERDALAQGIEYEVTRYELDDLDRALADGEGHGFVKVLTVPGKDKILGATIVGYHAGELITEFISAMRHGIGLNKVLGTIHIYPTLSEANKFAAGNWKKAHTPDKLLTYVAKFHAFMRG